MPTGSTSQAAWIRTSAEVAELVASLAGARGLALDTEADSLHHYREKVCLIQIASEEGRAWLLDPLAGGDLTPLGQVLADPAVTKVLHGADYDIVGLRRDFSFRLTNVFDTMVAARFLGLAEIGLQALLGSELGVQVSKSSQRDDWSRRPLTPVQEDYALSDVRHLLLLRRRLEERLRGLERLSWLEEECEAVASLEPSRRGRNGEAYLRIKGAGALSPRGLAVLRELAAWRERRAEEKDVPPFRVLDPKTLLLIASRPPTSRGELHRSVPFLSRQERNAAEILEAVLKAMALPENELPGKKTRPRPAVPALTARRIAGLRAWRTREATQLGLDVAVVLPQRLLEAVAEADPEDAEALVAIEGFRRWRAAALGPGVLAVLADARGAPD